MRRQRKEILKKMYELDMQEQAEHEMGCGFGTSEIAEAFAPYWQALREKMAATYGMTVDEYDAAQYETADRLYEAGILPYN